MVTDMTIIACRYSMVIQWSDQDQSFLVSLPEFGDCKTHGNTYEEAAKHGQEVLEILIESAQQDGEELPEPRKYHKPTLGTQMQPKISNAELGEL